MRWRASKVPMKAVRLIKRALLYDTRIYNYHSSLRFSEREKVTLISSEDGESCASMNWSLNAIVIKMNPITNRCIARLEISTYTVCHFVHGYFNIIGTGNIYLTNLITRSPNQFYERLASRDSSSRDTSFIWRWGPRRHGRIHGSMALVGNRIGFLRVRCALRSMTQINVLLVIRYYKVTIGNVCDFGFVIISV